MSNCVNNMTNEEIWKMLQPKLLKNYIFPNNVSEAVGMAYRVGYLRAMKGRPFKIGEKKKKGGHWEPVDIEQVLKGECKVVEDCLGWHYEYLGTYKKGEDGKFYQWVEDDE